MSHLALQDSREVRGPVVSHASSTTLPDCVTDKSSESDEISSSTPESSQSESSMEDTSPTYEGMSNSSTLRRHGGPAMTTLSHASSSSSSPSSHMTSSLSQPSNSVDVLSSSITKPQYSSSSKGNSQELDKNPAILPGKLEGEQLGGCYSSEEGRRASASLISSVLLPPPGDTKALQNLEGMNLSSYVKLMNLDVANGLALNLQEPTMPGSTQNGGHMIPGAGHMIAGMNPVMGGRGGMKTTVGDYHSPPRASLSMTQASAFLIPSPNQAGFFAIQDNRPAAIPGIVDMGPPSSFSPGLSGGLNSVPAAAAGGGTALNFFPPQAPASSSSPPRQPTPQVSSLHGRRLGKRSHDLLVNERHPPASTDFSPNIMRDITFPPVPDSGCGSDKLGADIKAPPPVPGGGGFNFSGGAAAAAAVDASNTSQHLKWQAHMVSTWMDLCDGALQDIPQLGFQVETDKGFNYSIWDDAFVCQKKNHFQVTVTVTFPAIPKFVKMKSGSLKPVKMFAIHLHGVKFEQINSEIRLEQSKSDRSKTKFEPEIIEIPTENGEISKKTLCRLHFSETTHNNMRKRGRPNPDQKYFSLVVALHADTGEDSFPVVAHVSERIIVRASNPGNFDNDCDVTWFKSSNPEYIYHQGRVGINTDKPEEALSVHGNIQVTGQILQASDARIKQNIKKLQLSQSQHLDKVSQLQLYEYQLAPLRQDTATFSHVPPETGTLCETLKEEQSRETAARDGAGLGGSCRQTCVASGYHQSGTEEESSADSAGRKAAEDVTACSERESGRTIVGLLAQEVRQVLPGAVMETKQEVQLANGEIVKRLLVIDKDQVLMEVVGAVQDLHRAVSAQEEKLLAHEGKKGKDWTETHAPTTSLNIFLQKESPKSILHSGISLTLQIRTTLMHCLVLIISLLILGLILTFIVAY